MLHSSSQRVRRDRSICLASTARRRRASFAAVAAAVCPGASHGGGKRRHGGRWARRGWTAPAARRAAGRRGRVRSLGDRGGIADFDGMTAQSVKWFWYASPQTFYPVAGVIARWCGAAAAVLCAAGLYIGLFVAPTAAQQGEAYRIIFIHVPAAWMSMFIYVVMAFWAAIGLAFSTRLSHMM